MDFLFRLGEFNLGQSNTTDKWKLCKEQPENLYYQKYRIFWLIGKIPILF